MNVHTNATSTAIMNLHAHAAMIAKTSARWMFDMTSKALEAARLELAEWGYDVPSEWLAMAIRAFGQNLSEEAAELIWSERGHLSKQEAVLAAIEKDLE